MVLVALAIGGLGSTARLVDIAERRELGPDRDRWVAGAERLDRAASGIGADRPAAWLGRLVERDRTVRTDLRLGDLAGTPTTTTQAAATTASTPPTTSRDATPSTAIDRPTTTTTTMQLPPTTMRRPTAEAPLRIWVGGDSLGEYVGSAFLNDHARADDLTVTLDHHIATGLARPDYFDWPARLAEAMADPATRPEVIVFMVGGNDDQAMRGSGADPDVDTRALGVGTPGWFEEYSRRVATVMDVAAYDGVHLYWLRLPPMADPERDRISRRINDAIDAAAAERAWVTSIDLDPLLAGADGAYEARRPDPSDGEIRTVRQTDGIHVNRRGSGWIADIVLDAVDARWGRSDG